MHSFENHIRNVADFPKAGVVFKDISPLLKERFNEVVDEMSKDIPWNEIDFVLGIESRGFILGAAMAGKFGKGFVPVRKKGKLPPPTMSQSYSLEYGTDTLEMMINTRPSNVVIVDDVLATGGTLGAVLSMCEKNYMNVKALSVLINLTFLNKYKEQGLPLYSVLNY